MARTAAHVDKGPLHSTLAIRVRLTFLQAALGCDSDRTIVHHVAPFHPQEHTFASELDTLTWPEWMRGRSSRAGLTFVPSPSSSAVGFLHKKLRMLLDSPRYAGLQVWRLDDDLLLPGREKYLKRWDHERKQYVQLVSELCAAWPDEEERKQRISELKERMLAKLHEGYPPRNVHPALDAEPPTELLLEVSAIYQVTYKPKVHLHKQSGAPASNDVSKGSDEFAEGNRGDGVSFAWIFGEYLLRLKVNARSRSQSWLPGRRGGPVGFYLPAQLRELL